MANKLILLEKGVAQMRIDGARTFSEKTLTAPDEENKFFGSFKFDDPKEEQEAEETFQQAIEALELDEDNFFEGEYPRWDVDDYGKFLRCKNHVRFIKDINTREEVPVDEVRDYVYSLEVHIAKTRAGLAFLRIPRAVVLRESETSAKENDELFSFDDNEDDSPF